ncbi:MAG: CheY-like response regulator receiver domain protein [Verrucomicrobiales bacterium]|nr:CheY-like response regulator receiver domain protein [Verrucomicrobiales bacterium]
MLARLGVKNGSQVMGDGETVVDYLRGNEGFDDKTLTSMPAIMFLDFQLPKANAFQLLEWIREREVFNHVVLIGTTSSEDVAHINRFFEMGGNYCLMKPLRNADLVNIINLFRGYWDMPQVAILPFQY